MHKDKKMKKTFAKLMAAMLVLALAVMMLAGCAGENAGSKELFIGATGPLTGGASSGNPVTGLFSTATPASAGIA